jgi:hypothetical protein
MTTARKINFYLNTLGTTTDHRQLFSVLEQLASIQETLIKIAPRQLAQYCSVGGFSGGSLTIYASNSAIAAKLKQSLPSILLKFQENGHQVTAIRVAVQAHYPPSGGSNPPEGGVAKKRQIGEIGKANLSGFAAELPPSPLKTAIKSMLKKQPKIK